MKHRQLSIDNSDAKNGIAKTDANINTNTNSTNRAKANVRVTLPRQDNVDA